MQCSAIMAGSQVGDEGTVVLLQLIDAANARRKQTRASVGEHSEEIDAETRLESLFRTSERLAVYGSLAPGRQNHHIVAPFGGTWTPGYVEGDLVAYGWGAAIGFPALYTRRGGPAVPVHVLTSSALPGAWPGLDAFEGTEYRRVLVPVWSASAPSGHVLHVLLTVANLYEATGPAGPPLDVRDAC
jgi:gamma-glutamylcyclotransferase (GGCT)/AIG2-like uncharacterized protein YtfP